MTDEKFYEMLQKWETQFPVDLVFASGKTQPQMRLAVYDYIERRKLRICMEKIEKHLEVLSQNEKTAKRNK
jgi:hypothetical protein